jgi:hypothetical protein
VIEAVATAPVAVAQAPVETIAAPAANAPEPTPVAGVTTAPSAPATSGGRVSNDPRINRRQVAVTVETQAVQIDFSQAPAAQPDTSRSGVTRASNDPRKSRNPD